MSAFLGAEAFGQQFEKTTHNFGTVARGANTEFIFEFTNNHSSNIVVDAVRASCGCTTPSITQKTVAPGEKGGIRAKFNTLSFVGQRGATITVTMSQPFFQEVTLRVDGYVRRDMVLTPGEVSFGIVPEGEAKQKTINLAYAGRGDWAITKATCSNPKITVELKQTRRDATRVDYNMVVSLAKDAEIGQINDQIILETNDNRLKTVPVPVSGKIQSSISVSSDLVAFGEVKKGEMISKTVFVKAKTEFSITSITSTPSVRVTLPLKASKIQRIPLKIDTTNLPKGDFNATVTLQTDMGGMSKSIRVAGKIVD